MVADVTIYRDGATTEEEGKGYTNNSGALISSLSYSGSGNTIGREYTLTYRSATADILVETVDDYGKGTSWALAVLPGGTYNDDLVPGLSITLGGSLNNNDQSTVWTGRAYQDSGGDGVIVAGNNSTDIKLYAKNNGADRGIRTKAEAYPHATYGNSANAPITAVREPGQEAKNLVADAIDLTVTAVKAGPVYDFLVHGQGGKFGDFTLSDVAPATWTTVITGLQFECDTGLLVNDAGTITVHSGMSRMKFAPDNPGVPGTFAASPLTLSSAGETDGVIDPAEVIPFWVHFEVDASDGVGDNRYQAEVRITYAYTE